MLTLAPLLKTVLGMVIAAPLSQTIYVDDSNPNCPGSGTSSDPYCVIVDAVLAAADGDVIEVAPGIYTENLNLQGKSVTIRGRDGAAVTILDGSTSSAPILLMGLGETVTLEGLTLRNTVNSSAISMLLGNLTVEDCVISGNSTPFYGGGISSTGTVTIRNTVVSGNQAAGYGGGVFVLDGALTIEGCTFSGNTATDDWGGAIHADIDSPLTITDTVFDGNTAGHSGGAVSHLLGTSIVSRCEFRGNSCGNAGGGFIELGDLTITDSTFRLNMATDGGGLATHYGSLEMTHCVFTSNTATATGGGLESLTPPSATVTACVFDGNSAGTGGGTYIWGGGLSAIRNSTFYQNTDGGTGGGAFFQFCTCELTNSILWQDTAPAVGTVGAILTVSYSDVAGGYVGTGNIDADPVFLAPSYGDFRLACDSPCIDAADGTISLPATDLEGDDRVVDGDSDGTATPDMGADEFDMLWVVNQPAAVQYDFTAMAPPAQHGNPAFLFLSLGDGSTTGGLPVPVSGGQRLYLDADVLLNAWLNWVSVFGTTSLTCPPSSTTPVPSNPGLTVYYAGFSVDLGTGKIPSVSPTHSYVTQ